MLTLIKSYPEGVNMNSPGRTKEMAPRVANEEGSAVRGRIPKKMACYWTEQQQFGKHRKYWEILKLNAIDIIPNMNLFKAL